MIVHQIKTESLNNLKTAENVFFFRGFIDCTNYFVKYVSNFLLLSACITLGDLSQSQIIARKIKSIYRYNLVDINTNSKFVKWNGLN